MKPSPFQTSPNWKYSPCISLSLTSKVVILSMQAWAASKTLNPYWIHWCFPWAKCVQIWKLRDVIRKETPVAIFPLPFFLCSRFKQWRVSSCFWKWHNPLYHWWPGACQQLYLLHCGLHANGSQPDVRPRHTAHLGRQYVAIVLWLRHAVDVEWPSGWQSREDKESGPAEHNLLRFSPAQEQTDALAQMLFLKQENFPEDYISY